MKTARTLLAAGLVAMAALASGGCSSSDAKGGPIESRDWHVTAYLDAGGAIKDAYLTVPLDARFEGGKIAGAAGCDTYSASYTLSGEKLTVTDVTAGTAQCDSYANEGRSLFMASLPLAATFKVDGTQLTIYDQGGKEVLRFAEKS